MGAAKAKKKTGKERRRTGKREKGRFAIGVFFSLKNSNPFFEKHFLFKVTANVIKIIGKSFLVNVDPTPARNKAALLLFLPALLRCLSFLALPFGPPGPRMFSYFSF